MDRLDLRILKTIQREFPLEARPYDALSRRLNISADEVFARVSALRRRGVIRRLGPLFSSRRLGLRGHLVAVQVEAHAVDRLAQVLARHHEVTHNYLRDGRFNLWFTLLLGAGDAPERVLAEVRSHPGVSEVLLLPSRKMFKLDASFEFMDNADG